MLVIINHLDPIATAIFGCHKAEHCYKWLRENAERDRKNLHVWHIDYNGKKAEAVVSHERYRKSMKFPFDIPNE